jgi:hypothetical protein
VLRRDRRFLKLNSKSRGPVAHEVTGQTVRETGNPHTLPVDSRRTLHVGSIEVPLQEQDAVARVPSGLPHAQLVWIRKSALE